ncbi:MAG: TolC family outer membrane protein [Methylocystis sp.]
MVITSSIGCLGQDAAAETLHSALARAYSGNPEINRQRSGVRAQDEDTPNALAGMRPKAGLAASIGPEYSTIKIPAGRTSTGQRAYFADEYLGKPRSAALSVSQTLFDGGRTQSAVRQAQSGMFAARANLGASEQSILQNGVSAYMDVLRDTAILALRKNNNAVLEEQLRHTRVRYQFGEVTAADVAQAEAALARGRSDFSGALAVLQMSAATYRQIVGVEPQRLEPAGPVEQLLPKSLNDAVSLAIIEHPMVVAALHQVDAAEQAVKVAESALSPTLAVGAQVSPQGDSFMGWTGTRQFSALAAATLNVPLYQGGSEYASIRKAKEQLSQARLGADAQRDNVRRSVVFAYAQLQAAKASIVSGQAEVAASEKSLSDVREEAKVGQRTTLDILNAQQALLGARVSLVIAQHDRVVASFAALAAVGRLSARELNLDVAEYDPTIHYEQVKEKWFGLDTPDGR